MSKKEVLELLTVKKNEFKNTNYRKTFDALVEEADKELIDTAIKYESLNYNSGGYVYFPSVDSSGRANPFIIPTIPGSGASNSGASKTPRSKEAIAFSKVLTVTSALFSNIPNGTTNSSNKLKARVYKEIWKQGWLHPQGNGLNCLSTVGQSMVTYGCGAWRVYPKLKSVQRNGVEKILFDGIYREPLNMKRTWFGTSYRPSAQDARVEVLYEIDVTKEQYKDILKKFNKKSKIESGVSSDSTKESSDKGQTHVTITFYENPNEDKYIIASDVDVLYEGEMPNTEVYGGVVPVYLYLKNSNDPYGVGLFEMIRGNVAIFNYLNSLNVEQVEAEVFPLLFATGNLGSGNLTYNRSPNKINVFPAGVKIDRVQSSGNVTLGINYANSQKGNLENNAGVTDALSGLPTEGGLGEGVMQREASLNRWILPRNNIKGAIEVDGMICFSWYESLYILGRNQTFTSVEKAMMFEKINKCFFTDQVEDLNNPTAITINYSPSMSIPFDFNANLDTGEQNIIEHGQQKVEVSIKQLLQEVEQSENNEDVGYSEVSLYIDPNSLLVPSIEIQKQSSQVLFPMIVNQLKLIYTMAREDPEQAIAQLTTLGTFCKEQRVDIFAYIPKSQYDTIISGGVPVDMATQMKAEQHMAQMNAQAQGQDMGGTAPVSPNTSISAGVEGLGDNQVNELSAVVDAARRQGQTPLQASQQASMGRLNNQ